MLHILGTMFVFLCRKMSITTNNWDKKLKTAINEKIILQTLGNRGAYMDDIFLFVNRLKELMEDKGLNNTILSQKIGCSDSAIEFWLSGTYYPRYNILVNLSDYFHYSIHFILGLTEKEEYKPSDPPSDFLTRFNLCMKEKHLTAYKLWKNYKISQSTVSNWKKKGNVPETASLIALSKIFDCTVDFLLGRADD